MKTLLKITDVAQRLCGTKDMVRYLLRTDPTFPTPLVLSPKTHRWDEEEIAQWLTTKKGVRNETA